MKLKLLLLVLALQVAWVLGTVVRQENLWRVGQVVLLETQPVDPRDPLRGDFVRLNYQISDVPRQRFIAPPLTGDLPYGAKIFVAIAPAGTNRFYEVTRAGREWFPPAETEVILRGKAVGSWRNRTNSIHVEYGLEHYFVAEGTGNPHGKLTAQAAVTKSGRASLKEVFVDGKPYAEAMKADGR
jgi:uncharacterized membrane-anchored protein